MLFGQRTWKRVVGAAIVVAGSGSVVPVAFAQDRRRCAHPAAAKGEVQINRVAFEGNSKVKGDTLAARGRDQVALHLRSGRRARRTFKRIREIYRRSGRAAATRELSHRRPAERPHRRRLHDRRRRQDRREIHQLRRQQRLFGTGRLVGLMSTTEMNFLSFLKTTDVYDPERIASDLELVRRFYLKNGYADFRVVSSDARFDPAQGGYIITITIEEGPQYRVASVGVTVASSRRSGRQPAALRHGFARRHLQRRCRREDRRAADQGSQSSRLCLLAGSSARRSRSGDRRPSPSISSSTKVRASTSSASTFAATPARATMSFAASSRSAKATPTTAF